MNEENTPQTPAGHEFPSSFSSQGAAADPGRTANAVPQGAPDAPAAPGAGFVPPTGIPPYAQGAAFGVPTPTGPDGQPTIPLGSAPLHAPAPAEARKDRKGLGAGKVAAVIVAAALVGGAAGVGGSYLGSTIWQQPVSQSAQGPETLTVNNPGSVNETTAIAAKVLPSVVTIEVADGSSGGSGSGVVLSDDGYVLTNTHVVTLGGAAADPSIRVTTSDGRIYQASIVGTDPIYDLAVIKLEGAEGLDPIEFADSSALNVGSTAVAVGAPLGLSNSVTTSIVSALSRSI